MGINTSFISNKNSKEVINNSPKLPLATDLADGEIAVNFAKDYETLAIKNESGDVVTFSSDNKFYKKLETSGATEIQTALGNKQDTLELVNPSAETKVGLVNSLSQYYDTNIGKGAVIEGDGYEYNGTTYNVVASGDYSHAEGRATQANGNYSHAEGNGTSATSNSSHAEGQGTQASGSYSHAEGDTTQASGNSSHAEGNYTQAFGGYSHAEGYTTTASGDYSHAEGSNTIASGYYSHAEGDTTKSIGSKSHAEGSYTQANGMFSHAEGVNTQAIGISSHAEGVHTIANNESEHASGQYNVSSSASTTFGDSGNTLFSVGNGVYKGPRHNAFEIRQNGDIYITSGGTDIKLQDHLGGSGSQIQSDWDESDITSDAYIKNRPFYGSTGYTVIYNETINCEQNGPTHGGTNFTPTEELIVGKTYKVTIDSDEYVVKAVSPTALNLNENWSTPFNDTWSIFKSGNYYSICINGAIGQTKSVKIEKQYLIVEKQIESEYVDLSNYYNKTECDNKYLTAQTQSDWNQNYQYSASFIKNKPFGVETYVKSEKVYEGTFNRSTYSTEEFKQVYWDGNISSNILSVGDYIRLVINGEDRGDYAKVVSNSGTIWKVNYRDSANGYSLYPNYNNNSGQLNFYGLNANPATNLPSGDTISVEIWKCALGEKKLDNKYVDYENSSYIKAIENSIPKIWTGTQSEYDALTNKDSSTIYFIK